MASSNLSQHDLLQQKIFQRWVNQRLGSRHMPLVTDVLTDLGQGDNLPNLMTALSEKVYEAPKGSPRKMAVVMKAQKLEAIGHALEFVFSCGVEMKLRPSPANILDGDFRDIMGLLWGIMMRFMRFNEEDEEQLGAKEALLRWLQFHTKEYDNVEVKNLTKSFHNGLALCALVHKFRPDAIDYASLSPDDSLGNLKKAMDAAETCYGIEQYLQPAEIAKLDDKSMLVYVSEYYYGVNAAAKRALAAKRITKLVKFTRENDAMKAAYEAGGSTLLGHLDNAETLLADVAVIDNTMAGAVRRLSDFEKYKSDSKRAILTLLLEMEAQYSSLDLRLTNNGRPQFVPSDPKLALTALKARVTEVQTKEAIEPALHAELNRQHRLVQLDSRHAAQSRTLDAWIADKLAYTAETPAVTSSGEARKQLKLFDAYEREAASMPEVSFGELRAVGAELSSEKYENVSTVLQREAAHAGGFETLATQAAAKKPVLEDNLARELFREKTMLQTGVHTAVHDKIQRWADEKAAYLAAKASISSVQDARLHLSLLDAYDGEAGDMRAGSGTRLAELGAEIRGAKYETHYSTWVHEDPAGISALEKRVDDRMTALANASAGRRAVLEDDLAREELREQVELWAGNHKGISDKLKLWGAAQLLYLNSFEDIESSREAKAELALLEAYEKEYADTTAGALASLKALGAKINSTAYLTEYSSWKYPEPEAVKALEDAADMLWAELAEKSARKKATLDDDLARELYAEETRLLAGQHCGKYDACCAWATEKLAELEIEPKVASIGDAQLLISLLDAHDAEKAGLTAGAVASLKQLGAIVCARAYKTEISEYEYENKAEISEREAGLDSKWSALDTLSSTRHAKLEALLASEIRKEELRLDYADAAADYTRFCADKTAYLGTAEEQRTVFGSSLAEVEAYAERLSQHTDALTTAADTRRAAYTAPVNEGMHENNPYTNITVSELEASRALLDAALSGRQANFDTELTRRREDDVACRAFAAVVDGFCERVKQRTGEVTESSAPEETQLATVEAALAAVLPELLLRLELPLAEEAAPQPTTQREHRSVVEHGLPRRLQG